MRFPLFAKFLCGAVMLSGSVAAQADSAGAGQGLGGQIGRAHV